MKIIQGDCLEVMKTMEENSIDFIVTDPPYGLHFMGKNWDGRVPAIEIWAEALRVCKPGAMLAAFGGSRTHHHLMLAIEGAGWEIRDCIMWIYGSGFPKSLDVSKALDKSKGLEREIIGKVKKLASSASCHKGYERPWAYDEHGNPKTEMNITKPSCKLAKTFDGYGTALKPAYEPIIMAMKPIDGTFAQNAEKWGVAGINVNECRIEAQDQDKLAKNWDRSTITDMRSGNYGNGIASGIELSTKAPNGRWPANIIFDEEAGALLDEMTGVLKSGSIEPHHKFKKEANCYGTYQPRTGINQKGDSGGASRFFYCAKASSKERNAGLEGMPDIPSSCNLRQSGGLPKPSKEFTVKNFHPTVKPIALMKYILKLLAPPGNPICLDPFCGSGSTLVAAQEVGIECIGIEKQEEYCEIAENRLNAF